MRAPAEILRPLEHLLHEGAGSTQQIQLTEQQAMTRETKRSADLPSTRDALWGQIMCNGFCNELAIRQGLEWIWRFALCIVILLG
jgi:hypothetical protein